VLFVIQSLNKYLYGAHKFIKYPLNIISHYNCFIYYLQSAFVYVFQTTYFPFKFCIELFELIVETTLKTYTFCLPTFVVFTIIYRKPKILGKMYFKLSTQSILISTHRMYKCLWKAVYT